MWRYGTMVALTFLCAGVYMLFLLPFKTEQLIPGITEIRFATLFPVIFGLLFGPAGAWGSAIGNLGGDFFGTLSAGSVFGFAGNFLYAYIPYKLWYHIKLKPGEDRTPTINSPHKLAQFGLISFISSASCAVIIAWGLNVLKLADFKSLSIIITLNNSVITLLLGPIVLPVLYSIAKKNNLLWMRIMHKDDIRMPSKDKLKPLMAAVGAIGGICSGLAAGYISAHLNSIECQIPAVAKIGSPHITLAVLPFILALCYGSFNS